VSGGERHISGNTEQPAAVLVPTPAVDTATVKVEQQSSHSDSSSENNESSTGSDYDDIGDVTENCDDVTEVCDDVTEVKTPDNAYDGLQESTRDVVTQESTTYEQIHSGTAASAAMIGDGDKPRVYMKVVGDGEMAPMSRDEVTKAKSRYKWADISAENAAKASTL